MGTTHQKKREHEPVGPFAPPKPSEVDGAGAKPVAVARDEGHTTESDSPTTQSADAFSERTARRNADPNMEKAGASEEG